MALTAEEQQAVLAILHAERFVDKARQAIYATRQDDGSYHCSPRTMSRLFARAAEVRERRSQRRGTHYQQPELWATAPNQVWSWDITKRKGSVQWSYDYLDVILDISSRSAVGWMGASQERAGLAQTLIQPTCHTQGIQEGHLTIHADRGSRTLETGGIVVG